MSQPDPYEVLRLPLNFTVAQLRANYKRLALQLHPDKNVVSTEHAAEIFKILTSCYKKLSQEHDLRSSDKQHSELRTGAKQHVEDITEATEARRAVVQSTFIAGDGHFDSTKFNTFFAENKMSDPVIDKGYGDWLRTEHPVDRPQPQSSRSQIPKECKSLMLHMDSLALGRTKLGFSEMGMNDIDDFSLVSGTNKCVGATDLRVAYSHRNAGDDDDGPSAGSERKTYKNIEELERDRAQVSYSMNDKESSAYDRYKRLMEKKEASQQSHIRRADQETASHFGKIQNRLTAMST